MLDFRLLTFLDLCQSKNYTKTAENLNITQPAVSQHIKYLEQYYGAKLISYHNRQFSLTKEGEYLLKEVSHLHFLSTSIHQHIQQMSSAEKSPSISIVANPAVGEFILPGLISAFAEQHPSCKIRSSIANSEEMTSLVFQKNVDFLISDQTNIHPDLEYHLFCMEPICCVCNPCHPLARKHVSLDQLTKEKIVYRERTSHAYEILFHAFQRIGHELESYDYPYEFGSMSSIIQYLKEGSGISFIYQSTARDFLERNELSEIYINDGIESISFYCAYPKAIPLSDEAKKFLEFCKFIRQ